MVSISKLLSGQNILIGLVVVILIGGIYVYTSKKSFSRDAMTSGDFGSSGSGSYARVSGSSPGVAGLPQPSQQQPIASKKVGITANGEPSLRNSAAQNVVQPKAAAAAKDVANPSELLPASGGTSWAKLNPNADTNQVIIPDLLEAGYHIGLDTIGQTLKNPNLQERSEPIIPKQAVSPWNNSSYEPDIARVPLEIGYGCN
jgi:hypothetical protein